MIVSQPRTVAQLRTAVAEARATDHLPIGDPARVVVTVRPELVLELFDRMEADHVNVDMAMAAFPALAAQLVVLQERIRELEALTATIVRRQ